MNHPRACPVNKTFLATRPFTEKERDNRRGKKTLVRVAKSVSSRPRPALTSPRHGPLKFQRHTHIRTRICTRYYVRIHSQRADTRAYPTSIRPIFVSRPWIIENDVARERERRGQYHGNSVSCVHRTVAIFQSPFRGCLLLHPLNPGQGPQFHGDASLPMIISAYPCSYPWLCRPEPNSAFTISPVDDTHLPLSLSLSSPRCYSRRRCAFTDVLYIYIW